MYFPYEILVFFDYSGLINLDSIDFNFTFAATTTS
jgi:hypothetical protein